MKPEFLTYSFLGETKPDHSLPRIGTLYVSDDYHGSDCNFYPNHEVFGICSKGEYPLYAKFDFVRDERTNRIVGARSKSVFASVPGTSYDGKVGFHHPFNVYDYEVGEYLGEGKTHRGVTFRMSLDEPFHLGTEKYEGILGYDLGWLSLS